MSSASSRDLSELNGRKVEVRPGFAGDLPAPSRLRGVLNYNARNGKFTLYGAEQYSPADDSWNAVEFPVFGWGPWLSPSDWNVNVVDNG
jgi:hypothetical protein